MQLFAFCEKLAYNFCMSEKPNDSSPVVPLKKDIPQVNRAPFTGNNVDVPKNPESLKKAPETSEKP